ncbi:hypothetical protein SCAR479_00459 [Seiridium cardinale]|uniref:Apple domain-containing protein n=1 Tax=Seiridium cardinale TaxID=138064 RepID=A0ABR2Y9K4_9PEZI
MQRAASQARPTVTVLVLTLPLQSNAQGPTANLSDSKGLNLHEVEAERVALTSDSTNGVQFQVWCGRNIIEYTNPLDWTGKLNAILNMNRRGSATLQNCWDMCAADPKCQGTNWWWGKGGCGMNNFPEQSASIFRRGGKYKNPPDVAWIDPRVIALVAVPKR